MTDQFKNWSFVPPSVAIRAVAELSFGSISSVAMRGERMVMVYFPEHRLLYGSDLVQKMRDSNFYMP